MDFLNDIVDRYSSLPNVTVRYHHSYSMVLLVDGKEAVEVAVWPYGESTVYRVAAYGAEGSTTTSPRTAKDLVWIYYLDTIGDLV